MFLQILAIILIIPTSWAEKKAIACAVHSSVQSPCHRAAAGAGAASQAAVGSAIFSDELHCEEGSQHWGTHARTVPVGLALSCKCGSKGGEHGFGKLRSSSTSSPWVNEEKLVHSLELEVKGAPTRD